MGDESLLHESFGLSSGVGRRATEVYTGDGRDGTRQSRGDTPKGPRTPSYTEKGFLTNRARC